MSSLDIFQHENHLVPMRLALITRSHPAKTVSDVDVDVDADLDRINN